MTKTFNNLDKSKPLLLSLQDIGQHINYGCSTGRCGKCECRLVDGEIHQLGETKAANYDEPSVSFLACQWAAKSDSLTVSSSEWLPFPLPKVCSTPAKLNSVRCINDSLTEIELRLAPSSLFECLPGQFVDVSLTREVKRSYSIYRFNPVSRTISF